MVDRYLSPNFGVNSFNVIRKRCLRTDDGQRRTTDAHVTTVALLCSSTGQKKTKKTNKQTNKKKKQSGGTINYRNFEFNLCLPKI